MKSWLLNGPRLFRWLSDGDPLLTVLRHHQDIYVSFVLGLRAVRVALKFCPSLRDLMRSISASLLEERLAAGLGNPGGARGSLTRVATASAAAKDDGDNAWKNEIDLTHVELTKLFCIWKRHEAELEETKNLIAAEETPSAVAAEEAKVADSRQTLNQSLSVQSCRLEYSALAKICTSRHPQSSEQLRAELLELERERDRVQAELDVQRTHVHIRQGQVQQLLTSIMDLKQSLTAEDINVTPEEIERVRQQYAAKEAAEKELQEQKKKQQGKAAASKNAGGGSDPMEVDKSEGEEDEDALYGDL